MTKLIRFDWAIKNIFKRKKDLDILESFLSDLLKKNVKIDSLLDSETLKNDREDKSTRIDMYVSTDEGEKILIEIQSYSEQDYLSRALYGVSRAVLDHIKEGDPYEKVPKIISVNILYFKLGEGTDYIYRGTTNFVGMNEHDELQLNEKEKKMYQSRAESVRQIFPEYYLIKVNNFGEKILSAIDEWIYFL